MACCVRFWSSCAIVEISGRGNVILVDGWFESEGGGDSGDLGIDVSWRQISIGWEPRELLCISPVAVLVSILTDQQKFRQPRMNYRPIEYQVSRGGLRVVCHHLFSRTG